MQLLVQRHHLLILLKHLLLRPVLLFPLLHMLKPMSRDILLVQVCKLMLHLPLSSSMLINLLLLLSQLFVNSLSLCTHTLCSVSLI